MLNQNETTLAQQKQQTIKDALLAGFGRPTAASLTGKKYNELLTVTRPRDV